MAEPWADPNGFGAIYGAVAGGLGGPLAGLLGAAAGALAPRGKARGLVLGGFGLFLALGAASLLVGLYALGMGQPPGIWFPMVLTGSILLVVMGSLLPVVRRRYAEAERRRIDAEGLRTG